MADALWLVLAFGFALSGMGLLALTQKPHWDKVQAPRPYIAAAAPRRRALGGIVLAVSLALCLAADPPLLALLVWVMALAVSAAAVAFTLAYRPRWLGWLVRVGTLTSQS